MRRLVKFMVGILFLYSPAFAVEGKPFVVRELVELKWGMKKSEFVKKFGPRVSFVLDTEQSSSDGKPIIINKYEAIVEIEKGLVLTGYFAFDEQDKLVRFLAYKNDQSAVLPTLPYRDVKVRLMSMFGQPFFDEIKDLPNGFKSVNASWNYKGSMVSLKWFFVPLLTNEHLSISISEK